MLADLAVGDGQYVLYWMQSAVRTHDNHALEWGATEANRLDLPLVVGFGVDQHYPESSARHHRFLIEGLAEVQPDLERRKIGFRVEVGAPNEVALDLSTRAAAVVTDRGYLRHQRQWRQDVAARAGRRLVEVETNMVVPVEMASTKREYAARTLRPKIHRHLDEMLTEVPTVALHHDGRSLSGGVDLSDPSGLTSGLDIDHGVDTTTRFSGGQESARTRLDLFLESRFSGYADKRGEPSVEMTSGLSPYLHFGHISPVTAVLAAADTGVSGAAYDTFVEELVVRRELSHNYVWFEPNYDSFAALPEWARKTLAEHADDPRHDTYSRSELEGGQTHDRYWNAAMAEMRHTGYLHNHMRMYWGKQILAWMKSPEEAYDTALHFNNRYLLDGRDPNSYAGVGWCFGLHDRAWPERDVFGKVRTMTSSGLRRKKDIDAYVDFVERITGEPIAGGP